MSDGSIRIETEDGKIRIYRDLGDGRTSVTVDGITTIYKDGKAVSSSGRRDNRQQSTQYEYDANGELIRMVVTQHGDPVQHPASWPALTPS